MIRFITLMFVFTFALVANAMFQTDTTFTYQGELKQNGNPANGLFNLDFSLWNAASDGGGPALAY